MSTGDNSTRQTVARGLRHTQLLLVLYYLLAEVWGVRNVWFWEPSRLDFLVPVTVAVALGWWAIVDAKQRGMMIPMFAQPWFILLAGIVVPGYIIWSRRWRGVGWVALHAALWIVLATVAMHVGGVIVFGGAWMSAVDN
jgi:hypothetical protein